MRGDLLKNMKNKKILHIIDKYGLGGVESIIYQLIENFNNKQIECSYLFLRDCNIKKRIYRKNVIIKDYSKFSLIKPLRDISKIINKKNINVIHTHHRKGFYLSYILSNKFPKIKFIHHEHGDIFPKNLFYVKIMNLFSKRINLIIAVSQSVKNELIKKENLKPNKIKVLHNFVDPNKFNRKNIKVNINKEKAKLGIKKEDFVIGFVGRLCKIKGCVYLIKALPYLDFKYKVLVVGDGDLRKSLENLAKNLNVTNKVIFLGHINKIQNIYPLFDILVMPSLSEASPMVLFESWAMGIPVIGSNIPSLKGIIKSKVNGILFELGNEIKLANTIKFIKNNEIVRRKIIKFNYEDVKNYSLKEYIKKLEEFYSIL